jgi:hypothetical protein
VKLQVDDAELQRIRTSDLEDNEANDNYRFISPLLMCESLPIRFTNVQVAEAEVRAAVESSKARGDITMASVYFRDLNNGPWFGVNEREPFSPASLMKVPLMITYLWMVDLKPQIFDVKVRYDGNDFPIQQNYNYADPLVKGQSYSVKELVERMITTSDNVAMTLLIDESLISLDLLERVYDDLGVGTPSSTPKVDSITYASFFRILYNATYVSRNMSEYALKVMSNSEFSEGLRAGVPQGVNVSHKFGERHDLDTGERQLHDCGIGKRTPGEPISRNLYPSAASTRAGVNGYLSMRTPVASKNALAIAAAAAAITSSPAPEDLSLRRCTTIGVTSGVSSNRRIG